MVLARVVIGQIREVRGRWPGILILPFVLGLTEVARHGEGQAHSFEALLGLSAIIERARKEPPLLPATWIPVA